VRKAILHDFRRNVNLYSTIPVTSLVFLQITSLIISAFKTSTQSHILLSTVW